MSRISLIVALALLARASAVTHAEVDPEVGESARLQAADKAFADAERSLAIRLLDKAIAQAEANAALLNDVRAADKALSERVASLRTSEEGKRLATALDEITAGQVQQLIAEPSTRPEIITQTDKELASVLADLKKLRADPPAGFVPPDQQQDELAQISVSLRKMLAHARERDGWITSLLSSAPKNPDLAKAPTLDSTLADFRSREQQAWNAAQRKGIDDAKPEALKQITESARVAELERSLERSRAALEDARQAIEESKLDHDMQLRLLREKKDRELTALNQKLAESKAQRTVVNAQTDVTLEKGKADAEKIRLKQKCEDPAVKQVLTPFTAVGLWQPGDKVGQPWIHEKGPISYSQLKKLGVLEATKDGLTKLYIVGNGIYAGWPNQVHPDKDRPKWGFPRAPENLRQEDWQELRRIQSLLNELGDTMVELKLLSP